jgi:hypothetical protein
MKFKISLVNQLAALPFLIVQIVASTIFIWYVDYDRSAIVIFSLGILLLSMPAAYLHIEYFLVNNRQVIEINSQEIILEKNGELNRFPNKEVKEIIVCKSASMDKGGFPFTLMEYYYYLKIVTDKGDEIIITSLMSRSIEQVLEYFKDVKLKRKKPAFAGLHFTPEPLKLLRIDN